MNKDMKDYLEGVADGGEGLILRKHGSLYEHGRSLSLVKFKVYISRCK